MQGRPAKRMRPTGVSPGEESIAGLPWSGQGISSPAAAVGPGAATGLSLVELKRRRLEDRLNGTMHDTAAPPENDTNPYGSGGLPFDGISAIQEPVAESSGATAGQTDLRSDPAIKDGGRLIDEIQGSHNSIGAGMEGREAAQPEQGAGLARAASLPDLRQLESACGAAAGPASPPV